MVVFDSRNGDGASEYPLSSSVAPALKALKRLIYMRELGARALSARREKLWMTGMSVFALKVCRPSFDRLYLIRASNGLKHRSLARLDPP